MKELTKKLVALLGAENFVTDREECIYYSQDVYRAASHVTCGVIRPGNTAELAAAVVTLVDRRIKPSSLANYVLMR